jgi:hypothetical protein
MAIQLLPNQISLVWDSIKYIAKNVDRISDADAPGYFRTLLISLLNSQAQCFVRLDDQRQLIRVCITKIIQDDMTKERTLLIMHLYSFKRTDDSHWLSDISDIRKFARNSKCTKMVAYSNNSRVFEIVESLGFVERFRSFSLEV